ncbi:unnamed protein product [Camellia sinensis]
MLSLVVIEVLRLLLHKPQCTQIKKFCVRTWNLYSEEFEPEALVDSGVAHRQDNSEVKTGLEETHRGWFNSDVDSLGNNENVKEICTQYGEVVNVQLPQSLGSKHKYFGFITFTSRESALACVEGINDAHIGQEVKVKANIAKPHFEGRLQKQGTRGGFKVKKKSEVPSMKEETERKNIAAPSKMKGNAKFKQAKKKGKMVTEEKGNAILRQKLVENLHLKAKDTAKCGKGKTIISRRQRDPHIRKGPNYGADFIEYRNPYAPGYSAPAVRCQSHAYNTVSGSKRSHADMEPHAGYIEPYQPHVGHLESVVGTQSEPHTGYHVPAVGNHSISRAGYLEPILGTRGQPHAGYLEPAIGRQGAGGHDLRGSGYSAYGAECE